MAKEYKVQMKVDGEWKNGRRPNTGKSRIFTDKDEAKRHAYYLKNRWVEYGEIWNDVKVPTDFRIVSREVSDWMSE